MGRLLEPEPWSPDVIERLDAAIDRFVNRWLWPLVLALTVAVLARMIWSGHGFLMQWGARLR